MTEKGYFDILKEKYEALGNHPTREQLHEYNEFKRFLRKEIRADETELRTGEAHK